MKQDKINGLKLLQEIYNESSNEDITHQELDSLIGRLNNIEAMYPLFKSGIFSYCKSLCDKVKHEIESKQGHLASDMQETLPLIKK